MIENENPEARALKVLITLENHLDLPKTEFDFDDAVADLLTDLRLFCETNAVDFYQSLDRSYQHYLAER